MQRLKKTVFAAIIFLSSVNAVNAAHYSIVVDAGSSGSRLHLFQYEIQNNYPMVTEKFYEETKPGISSFADSPDKAPLSLKKMFDDAQAKLKEWNIDPKQVPISVLGTAGMRLVSEDKQKAIYSSIRTYLQNNNNFFVNHIETISGKLEGVYDWLDVNYQENTFLSGEPTLGTIDMGGASTQIAFATMDTSKPEDETSINLNNKHYTVFSKSFLGLGMDQARYSMNKNDLAGACYPAGYSSTIPSFSGKYNFVNCAAAYQKIISQYDIANKILPFDQMQFALFSGAYYTYHFFGVENNSQGALEARINTICSLSWDELQSAHAGDKYLSTYCANGIFLDQLFYNTYHLQGSQMWVTNKSHQGKEIDWTLGAMLLQFLREGR
jgi:apyrase